MNIKKIIHLSLLFILCSCSNRETDSGETDNRGINLDIDLKNNQSSELRDICSKIEIIPLETNEKSLINGNLLRLIVHDGLFYIHDKKQNKIIVYDINGNMLLTTEKKRGRGPNEYYNCGHMNVDYATGNIEILDQVKRRIFQYSLKGEFIKSIKLPDNITHIESFSKISDEEYVLYVAEDPSKNKKRRLIIYSDKEKKVISNSFPYLDNYLHISTNDLIFQRLNNTTIFTPSFPSNMSYMYDKHKKDFIPRYHLDFGIYNIRTENIPVNMEKHKEYFNKLMEDCAVPFTKVENSRFLIISLILSNQSYAVIIDKSSNNQIIKKNIIGSKAQLLRIDAIDENCIYYLCPVDYIKYVIDEDLLDNNTGELIKRLRFEDNPVIIKYYLKDVL